MKVITIQDRKGNIHIINYESHLTRCKITMCNAIYEKRTILNEISLDNLIEPICEKCCSIFKKTFFFTKHENPKFYASVLGHSASEYNSIQRRHNDTKSKYEYDNVRKFWVKLHTLKLKLKYR